MTATIKRGTRFTLPKWRMGRRANCVQYATVTRVARGTVYYRIDTDRASAPSHTVSLALLQQYAEVTR
jgi:hypothetical protein